MILGIVGATVGDGPRDGGLLDSDMPGFCEIADFAAERALRYIQTGGGARYILCLCDGDEVAKMTDDTASQAIWYFLFSPRCAISNP